MAAFSGRWKLVESSNYDGYLKGTGANEETIGKAKPFIDISDSMPVNNVISFSGEEMTTDVFIGDKCVMKTVTVLGQECERTGMDGRKSKSIFTIEGNKLSQKSTEGPEVSSVYEVDGDNMCCNLTAGGQIGTLKYTRTA